MQDISLQAGLAAVRVYQLDPHYRLAQGIAAQAGIAEPGVYPPENNRGGPAKGKLRTERTAPGIPEGGNARNRGRR